MASAAQTLSTIEHNSGHMDTKLSIQGSLFLSYRSSEADFALRLAVDLKNAGIAVWMDRYDLRLGENWVMGIQTAVDNCTGMICIVSQDYVESRYTRRELTRAMQRGITLLPLLIQDVPDDHWPFELQSIQYTDFRHWRDSAVYDRQFASLLDQLHNDPIPSARCPTPRPVT
ncbi:MAG: toll/interleukin-1 receptor domain-containing protein [Chloroflexi bacterium]|nr:toll/interleukin-1 receptor domain-containing protein [Chloroflexota bacterium]